MYWFHNDVILIINFVLSMNISSRRRSSKLYLVGNLFDTFLVFDTVLIIVSLSIIQNNLKITKNKNKKTSKIFNIYVLDISSFCI